MMKPLFRRWLRRSAGAVLAGALGGGAAGADELRAEEILPTPGSALRELPWVEVRFSVPAVGVDAGDLLLNGQPAASVSEPAEGLFLFEFPQPPDGSVELAWREGHGIVARDQPESAFAGGAWNYTLDSTAPSSVLMISEFLADNRRTLNDEDGDASDWIELHNPEETPASVAGWALTDDPADPRKWVFPEVSVPGKGYLLVFASGKDRTNGMARLHTNFRLTDAGEFLALATPDGQAVSAFAPAYPRQTTDVAYGRLEADPSTAGFFVKPTPGGPNAASGPGFASGVSFSRRGGTFTTAFDLTLRGAAAGTVIRYTLDNSAPTNTSPVYSQPLHITSSTIVRARAWQDGLLPGPVRSETFLLLNGAATNFTSDLPVIVLHSLGRGAPSSGRMSFSALAVFEPVRGVTSLTNPPVLALRGGLQVRGSSTEGYPKSSYKVELWDDANLDRRVPLLGLPADSDWVLYAPNNFDVPLLHNPFVHQLSRDTGMYSPRTRFVEVFQNKATGGVGTNHYAGIYVLEEKIKIGPERVAIDELEPEHLAAPTVTGGYLLKVDRLDPGDGGLPGAGASVAFVDPKEREIELPQRKPQLDYLRTYFAAFNKALGSTATWRDPTVGYPAYVDVESWIDFHVLEVLSGNVDSLVLSTYFHKPRNGRIRFGPHWDFDRALGSTDGRDANPRLWSTGPFFSAPWWSRLFQDKDFWQRWVDRWQERRAAHFSQANLDRLIDELADEIRPAYPRELAKWRVRPRRADGRAGGTFDTEMQWMKNWLSNRTDFIDRQLTQPPRFATPGGVVSPGTIVALNGPPGAALYYTADGTDPRASQGGIAAAAVEYTTPLAVLHNVRIIARARDLTKRQSGGPPAASSTPWSGPVAATFLVNPSHLLLTEIMFHPAAPQAGDPAVAAGLEFLELLNAGNAPVDLTGFRLTNGVDFVFRPTGGVTVLAPGERAVVVQNRAAFRAAYPTVTNVAGEFAGSLDNAGNRLRLISNLEQTLFDLAYDNDWQPLADGLGFSLVPRSEALAPDELALPERWRASAFAGGSPGAADPPPDAVPRVRVNEVVSNPLPGDDDAIELFNESAAPADVSGWWLSDDFTAPRKLQLPPGSVIPAGGFLVIRGQPFAAAGFGFSGQGDDAFLFSAGTGGNLTGWHHGFHFGPQEPGTSFARHVTSDGREVFVPGWPTLGAGNRPKGPWPAAVYQVMFQPPTIDGWDNRRDEYIEISDLTANDAPVAAHDESFPEHTWRLRGSVDYDFPAGFRFPASRRLVIVGFDPAEDPYALAAFRARYRLDASTTILGPWTDALPNDGGTVRLLKPLPPVPAPVPGGFEVPYAVIEEITYHATAPWPAGVAGSGRALSRRRPVEFGDEPLEWTAWTATPGDFDTDGDGLPDRWEDANSLSPISGGGDDGPDGDRDGDGWTNGQEYLAGTGANDANDFLRLSAAPGDGAQIRLTIHAGPGRGIRLLQRDTAAGGDWRERWEFLIPMEGGETTVVEPATNSARFYRIEAR